MRLFISYSRKNRKFITEIRDLLEQGKHTTWYDQRIQIGADWQKVLEQEIANADAIIPLLSPEFLKSKMCRWEIRTAQKLDKPILPILIRQAPDLLANSETLSRIQYVNFSDPDIINLEVARLITSLRDIEAKRFQTGPLTLPQPTENESAEPASSQPNLTPPTAMSRLKSVASELIERSHSQITVYHPYEPPENDLFHLVTNIKVADLCLFDITKSDQRDWVELGIALGLGKKVVLLADASQPYPTIFNYYTTYSYTSEQSPSAIAQTIDLDFILDDIPIRTYCYLCKDRSCHALTAHVDTNRYLTITDKGIFWLQLQQQLKLSIQKHHNASTVQINDAVITFCDWRTQVTESNFVVSHLEHIINPPNLMTLGMAIGHAKPWLFINGIPNSLTALLSPVAQINDRGIQHFRDHQQSTLQLFLNEIFPSEERSTATLITADASPWRNIANIRDYDASQANLRREAISGMIRIFQEVDGNFSDKPYFLDQQTQSLTIGSDNSKSDIALNSIGLSRRHFKIFSKNNRYFVEDLGSRNLTFINDVAIQPHAPKEIFFSDEIQAGATLFVVWDERPFEQTQDFTKELKFLTVNLPISPPVGIQHVHATQYQVIYNSKNDMQETENIKMRPYYPLDQVLDALVKALRLAGKKHYFRVNGDAVDMSKSPLDLGLPKNTRFEIVAEVDKTERALLEALKQVTQCEHQMTVEQGQIIYEQGFEYLPISELFERVYQELFDEPNQTQLDPRRLASIKCPGERCRNRLYAYTIVAINR